MGVARVVWEWHWRSGRGSDWGHGEAICFGPVGLAGFCLHGAGAEDFVDFHLHSVLSLEVGHRAVWITALFATVLLDVADADYYADQQDDRANNDTDSTWAFLTLHLIAVIVAATPAVFTAAEVQSNPAPSRLTTAPATTATLKQSSHH